MTVDAADLGTYLGDPDNFDENRAEFLLLQARNLCSSVLTPLPDTADAVVLAVAGRAYVNVASARNVGLGSGQIGFASPTGGAGVGGLYLSRSDKAALRGLRTPGGSGAFTVDPTPEDAGTGSLDLWNQNISTYPVPYSLVGPQDAPSGPQDAVQPEAVPE